MTQVHIRINKSYQYDQVSIQELISCEQRLKNLIKDNYFKSLPFPKYENMLDILEYIDENQPYHSTNDYIDKVIGIPDNVYSTFKTISKHSTNTKQPNIYLNQLLEKYNQIKNDTSYKEVSKIEHNQLYFLNYYTLSRFIVTEEFHTDFLLSALKKLKLDKKENKTIVIFSNIMKLLLLRMHEDNLITLEEFNLHTNMFKPNKLECEIDFIEKILFIRDKIIIVQENNQEISLKIEHNKINKIKARENKKLKELYNKNPNAYIRYEFGRYYRDNPTEFLEYDDIRMINFKNRLLFNEDEFHQYSNFISEVLLNQHTILKVGTKTYSLI